MSDQPTSSGDRSPAEPRDSGPADARPADPGVGPDVRATHPGRRRLSLARAYSSASDEKRARRPTDVVLLGACLAGLLVLSVAAPGPTTLDESITELLQSLPGAAGWVWRAFFALVSIWAVALILLAAAWPGRRRLLLDYGLAAAVALAGALLGSLSGGTSARDALDALLTPKGPPDYLGVRIALCTAVVVTASPHLARWLRFWGRGLLLVGAAAGVVLGVDLPIGATAGFLVGVASAALTHLILGSPGGRPTVPAVAEGLAELGIEADTVDGSAMTLSGSVMFRAEGDRRGPLSVKAYGPDAWDGQLLTSTWNALIRTGHTLDVGAGRLQRAEHEALACLLAERAGVPTLPVVAVGLTSEQDVLVVAEAPAAAVLGPEVGDARIAEAWRAVGALGAAGMAHGAIGRDTVVLDRAGRVVLADFAAAVISADERALLLDQVRLLVTTALAAGPERALAVAHDTLGTDAFAALLPLLQPAALDAFTRRAVRDAPWGMRDLLRQACDLAGREPPVREKLGRASLVGIVKLGLIGAFSYWIAGFVSGVDWAEVADAFRGADPGLVAGALLLSPTVQGWLGVATLGATLVALRYVPVLMLQYAIQFIGLVVPSSAARVALEVRFFTGWGMAPAAAMSVGVIDSVVGFAVQLALIALILLTGLVALAPASAGTSAADSSGSSAGPGLLAVIAALLLVAAIATVLFPSLRRQARALWPRLKASVGAQLHEARGALDVLRHPSRITLMAVGNLGAQATQAVILGLCLAAFGQHEAFAGLVLVNTFVSLFAGFMPVPGGMGVAEAGYTLGLQALGVPADVAVSTAILFRMVTFYLPPLWGAPAMRWLRRREYL